MGKTTRRRCPSSGIRIIHATGRAESVFFSQIQKMKSAGGKQAVQVMQQADNSYDRFVVDVLIRPFVTAAASTANFWGVNNARVR